MPREQHHVLRHLFLTHLLMWLSRLMKIRLTQRILSLWYASVQCSFSSLLSNVCFNLACEILVIHREYNIVFSLTTHSCANRTFLVVHSLSVLKHSVNLLRSERVIATTLTLFLSDCVQYSFPLFWLFILVVRPWRAKHWNLILLSVTFYLSEFSSKVLTGG